MTRLLRRLRYLFSAERHEVELKEEIEFHRARKQELMEQSGVAAAAAAHATRRQLGNVTLAREDARHVWLAPWIESVWQDAGYALRVIRRNPGFALSMIVVISLGIGATAGVFGLIDSLVLRSLPVREPERLVYFSRPSFSYPVFSELQARGSSIFSSLIAWNLEQENVQWGTELESAEILMASGGFYSTLGIQAAIGRTLLAEDDEIGGGRSGMVAVISYATWQRRFGGAPDVVGRTIRIKRQPFTIVGVTRAGFFGVAPGLAPEVTIPLKTLLDQDDLESRTSSFVHLMGRLQDGIALERANTVLRTIWPAVLEATVNPGMAANRRASYLSRTTSLESANAGFSRIRNQFQEPLWMLLGLVALLLTVALASAANLLLARGVARQREFAVRLAIGAGRGRLIRQVLTEALVWTSLGGAAGYLLASSGSAALVAMMSTWENPITLEPGPTWRLAGFTLALAFLAALVCAIVPALRAARLVSGAALKESGQVVGPASRRWSLGKSLVVAQVALTVLLLFGAALFVRSLERIVTQDPGFERDGILVISTDGGAVGYDDARLAVFYTELLQRLSGVPGVQSASLSQYPPISGEDGAWTEQIGVDGAAVQDDATHEVYFNGVTPGYFPTVGTRMLQGRDFMDADHGKSRPVVIVNQSLARTFFRDQSPIGRTITIGRNDARRELEIVGVVGDVKYEDLREPRRSVGFLPRAQLTESLAGENLFAEARVSGPVAPAIDLVRREIRLLDRAVPLRIQTVSERIRVSLVRERAIAALASTLGLAALALACAGLYGLLAYSVSRQTREIGVRIALGANRQEMIWMVLRQSVVLALCGIVSGLAASLALGQYARNLLFQVKETDLLALAAASAIMFTVAIGAGFIPARRASRIDPMVALRTE
jgi:predicted permease